MNSDSRPPTITHLAKIALDNLWDDSKDLKYWLRMAEKLRKDAQSCYGDGDLQTAFIKFARAATLVMEHLPLHRDFKSLLTEEQRHEIHEKSLKNGIHMMEQMGKIKPILMQRVIDWDNDHKGRTSKAEVRFGEAQVLPSAEEHRRSIRAMQKLSLDGKPDAELRRTAALLAAQKAAAAGDEERIRRQRQKEDEVRERMVRQQEEERARHLRQQEEMRQREEEIRKRKDQMKKEKEEIARRQQEADEAARTVRRTISANNPGTTMTSSYTSPAAPSPFIEPYRLPLQSPATMYDGDATDSDSPQRSRPHVGAIEYPSRPPARGGSITYPLPITTTSLPPAQASIQYPQIMTPHQQHQGYQPAADNGFRLSSYPVPDPSPSYRMPYFEQVPTPPPTTHKPAYPGPSRPAPPLPQLPPPPNQLGQQEPQTVTDVPLTKEGLRQVNVPRECLSRFITIAMANTSKNLETCGLLLGRDRGHKFAVTTLLIPKQHATSDTCTMDEEELVLQFTEERALITLGWV
ncbi:hypothetical protein C0992_003586 [Termitomyces sp. T32_za158]|nr:hypothetical protein C0992_003586 [Termitomyces sp. T32_za158]